MIYQLVIAREIHELPVFFQKSIKQKQQKYDNKIGKGGDKMSVIGEIIGLLCSMIGTIFIWGVLLLPFVCIIGVFVNLFNYLKAKKQNKLNPDTFTEGQIKEKRNNVIILAVISVIIIAFYVFMAIRIHYTLSNAVLSM